MRDYETIETALLAAETGHLVFSTLHTLDATETINRIIAVFPPHHQKQIRIQLGQVLKAVISLRLMPRADGIGRVPAAEVLIATPYIRECIENKEKTKYIREQIALGTSQYGMQTFDQSLFYLYKGGLITLEEAMRRASNPTSSSSGCRACSSPPTSRASRWNRGSTPSSASAATSPFEIERIQGPKS
jgi:twitching motility protein PilT